MNGEHVHEITGGSPDGPQRVVAFMQALDRMDRDPDEGARIDAIIAAVESDDAFVEAPAGREVVNLTIDRLTVETTAPSQEAGAPSRPVPHPDGPQVVRDIAHQALQAGASAELRLTPQGELQVNISPQRRSRWPRHRAGTSSTGTSNIVAAVMTALVGALTLASMLLGFTTLAVGLAWAFSAGSLLLVLQAVRSQAIEARQRAQHAVAAAPQPPQALAAEEANSAGSSVV
ncbi:hypothetical protein AB0D33_13315 [Streptomyces sp. NPDC048404]|uniref:hypothetical protein n=1 Tax=unclassified Streptomyces TaxID=2593676 RepID=UPI0034305AE6